MKPGDLINTKQSVLYLYPGLELRDNNVVKIIYDENPDPIDIDDFELGIVVAYGPEEVRLRHPLTTYAYVVGPRGVGWVEDDMIAVEAT